MDTTLNMKHSGRLPVLASVEPVVARGSRVFLHHSLVDPAINQWGNLPTLQSGWQHPCHYFDGTEETVRWIFVLDLLNHCFWPDKDEPVWTVSYRGAPYSGYWGLAAALKRAHEEGIPLTRATFLSSISFSDLEKILSGNGGKLPLLEKRYENLREAGRILTLHWQGDIVNLVRDTAGSAVRTAKALVASFPGFRDEATFEGARVYFWKRAQIFASDLHTAFSGKLWGHFNDIDQLTAFADYKLPQVLRELGIISYHPGTGLHNRSSGGIAAGFPGGDGNPGCNHHGRRSTKARFFALRQKNDIRSDRQLALATRATRLLSPLSLPPLSHNLLLKPFLFCRGAHFA